MRVAVAGSTGVVGRHVVAVAGRRGHHVVELARAAGVDLTSGEGLAERVEVAAALVDLVESGPCGRAPDLAGPAEHELVDLARRVVPARGLGRRVVGVPLPGSGGRAMRTGALLFSADAPQGVVTFEEWLAQER